LSEANIPLSQDAALVVALAGTAMPFSRSAEDEAERWLRALRLHGQVGAVLQALGVGESPLMTSSDPPDAESAGTPAFGNEAVGEVTRRASAFAASREAETIGTADLLFGVLEVYGRLFDRTLYLRGTSREELIDRMADLEQPANSS
jgi:hypothetical protein